MKVQNNNLRTQIKNQIDVAHNEAKEHAYKSLPNDVAKNISKQIDEISSTVYELLSKD